MKMNEVQVKRASFMIADLLSNVISPPRADATLPPAANSSDSATGNDVAVSDVIDYSVQSPTSITSRGRIQNNSYVGQRAHHRLQFSSETYPRSNSAAIIKPVPYSRLLQRRMSPSSCFQEADVQSGGVDDAQEANFASAAVTRLSLEGAAARCVTPLHWQAVIQRALCTAGQRHPQGILHTTTISLTWR